ncbi:MAG: 4Fe-4S cluster-binding domain-containing protein [Candidatus Altiarchaeota archaeon]
MNMKPKNLGELNEEVKRTNSELSVLDLFRYMRVSFLKENVTQIQRAYIENVGTEWPEIEDIPEDTQKKFEKLIKKYGLLWDDLNFHFTYRLTELDDLINLFPELEIEREVIEHVINQGFLLSLLPLNLSLPTEAREKAIPKSDYYEVHPSKDVDPYGIFTEKSKITDKKTNRYLASRKFPHSALFNIHTTCHAGCVGCYKSFYVREKRKPLKGLEFESVVEQTKAFVDWLNENPEVYDIIMSGGEPLMVSNETVKKMFAEFAKAKNLRIIRICTGTVFLGLPFRIDDELLDFLKEFENKTGKRITFNVHLANHQNITPEALLAVHRIKERGFKLYSQVPIMEKVNFFKWNHEKTMKFLIELGKRQAAAGVEPYKFIVDMHPRTLEYYVPLEQLLRIWSQLGESHDFPELERPRTLSILCKEGNVILSGYTLLAIQKKIFKSKDLVVYTIPAVFSGTAEEPKVERVFTYYEPIMSANEDPQSLEKLKKEILSETKKSRNGANGRRGG